MEYKTYDNTILVEGKKYKWSGCSDGLYTSHRWTDMKCKIRKIDGDIIYIYDYYDNKEYKFTKEDLRLTSITFKLRKVDFIINYLF